MNQSLQEKSKQLYEFVCFTGVLLFAVLPMYMVLGPEKYGITFKSFAFVEVLILLVCFLVYLIHIASLLRNVTLKQVISDVKKGLCSFFSDQRYGILFVLVFVLAVISALLANDRQRAFSGTDFRPDGVLMYACFMSLFIFASSLKSQKYKQAVSVCYTISFVIVSFVMIQQYYGVIGTAQKADTPKILLPLKELYSDLGIITGHFYKGMTGTFYNSNHMGYYIAVCSGLFTGLFIKSENKFSATVLFILIGYSFWILIINNTFGAYIAVFVAVLLYGIYFIITKRTGTVKALLPVLLFICVSLSFSLASSSTDESIIQKNFVQTSKDIKNIAQAEDKTTVKGGSGRWQLWVNTLDMISDEPVIGYGPDNLKTPSIMHRMKMDRAHNEFLEISAAIGVPGGIFYYIGILAAVICSMRRKRIHSVSLGASVAVFAYLISSLFGVFLFYTACHLFVMLGLMKE